MLYGFIELRNAGLSHFGERVLSSLFYMLHFECPRARGDHGYGQADSWVCGSSAQKIKLGL